MSESAEKQCPFPGEADVICGILVKEVVAASTWDHIKNAAVGLSKVRDAAAKLTNEWNAPKQ